MHPQHNWIMQLPSKQQTTGSNPVGCTKTKTMEEILELIHNEFIESEEYYVFLRRLEEEKEEIYKKNNKNTCQTEKND